MEAGATFTLRFHYKGNVIDNYGNSVLYVGARESWYPHSGDASEFATYDLTFRWPKHLRLVATGEKSGEHEEGEFQAARWKSSVPVSEAGFNLGEYAVTSLSSGNHVVEVYANKLLEQAIIARLEREREPPEPNLIGRPPLDLGTQNSLAPLPPTLSCGSVEFSSSRGQLLDYLF